MVGHPQYYRQFGFDNVEELVYDGVPQEVFFVLTFDGTIPKAKVWFQKHLKQPANKRHNLIAAIFSTINMKPV